MEKKQQFPNLIITVALVTVIIILILLLSSCNKDKKTNKAGDFVATPTIGTASEDTADAESNMPSAEPTETPGVSPSAEPEPTEIPTVNVTMDAELTATQSIKPTLTPVLTKSVTVVPTVTQSVKPTATPTPTKIATVTVTPIVTQSVTPTVAPCIHSNVEYIYEVVKTEEQGHWKITEAWVEEIYSDELVCKACGYSTIDTNGDENAFLIHCGECTANGYIEIMPGYVVPVGSSYSSIKMLIETIEHPEERTWVVDVPASTTTVCVGYTCNSCGATVKY